MINKILENGLLPDWAIKLGIRQLVKQRSHEIAKQFKSDPKAQLRNFAEKLRSMHIAISTDKANEQHYEVPEEFYKLCLGEHLKYSCCLFENTDELNKAEKIMLDLYIKRADIRNGQKVLDMGCGWGSFTLYAAKKFENTSFIAFSNSQSQKKYIESEAKRLGLNNVVVKKGNIAEYDFDKNQFDRIVSIEMLEHVKNYSAIFRKLSDWLKDDGKLFVHVFTHTLGAYHFEVKDNSDWMSKYFFSGGMMPADRLFFEFQDDLKIENHWTVDGTHYEKTAYAWLKNMDQNKDKIIKVFAYAYGENEKKKWWNYWRIFFMSCSVLWGYKEGKEWFVSHYLFKKQQGT
jgi:cyclopropane-fatty-acyl-phospholipid synthase